MEFDTTTPAAAAMAATTPDTSKKSTTAPTSDDSSVTDDIRNAGGFQAYAKSIEAEKLAKLREKILESMGLSEEQLQEMPAKTRAAIEEVIAREIRMRLAGQKAMSADDAKAAATTLMAESGLATEPRGAGFDAMLALQEAEAPQQDTGKKIPGRREDEEK